ncbi:MULTISPECIES: glycosyltransferase family protein [Blautia]|uniref:hypothetical protein n=1 Tax=Blautia TaxID=572511 RepID=UPI000BA39D71|nr:MULTISPECIES: hypothetical protein [Blautia]
MRKILFVTGEYISKTAQNGLCVRFIVDELKKRNVESHILCLEEKVDKDTAKKGIFPIYYHQHINGLSNKLRQLKKFLHMPIENKELCKRLEKEIIDLDKNYAYDLIVAVINPVETAEALYLAKKTNPRLKCVLYEIDPASNRYKYPSNMIEKMWKKRSITWEQKVYHVIDRIIHIQSHKKHFSNNVYKQFEMKTLYSDIPSLRFIEFNLNEKDYHQINAIYAGAFYPVLREPDYMIDLFKALDDINLNIYTGNIYRKHIEELVRKTPNIQLKSFIPQEELDKKIYDSNLLVSIGNKESDFLPSKVLYYIGTGKIVLHLYSDENDVAKKYFEKYPKAILVDQNIDIKANINIIKRKLKEVSTLNLDEEIIKSIYHKNTPDYTASVFEEILNG